MVVLFPFEVPLYEAAGVDVEWVGHPLLDIVKPTLSKERAFRPIWSGSQTKNRRLTPWKPIPRDRKASSSASGFGASPLQRDPDLQFVIPLAPGIPRTTLSSRMKNVSAPVKVVEGFTYDVMNLCELLITASGTATLEGAILGKPMIIIYKVSIPSYWVGRALIRVDHIGLVNLVAEKEIAPELIQKDVNPQRIADEAFRILKDPLLSRKMSESMGEVRQKLGEPGAAQRAARIVCSMLSEPKS